MRLDIFTLCDYAQNVNGKLTIIGTFDNIGNANIPFRHSFSLAVRISGLSGDENRLNVSLKDPSGADIAQPVDADLPDNKSNLNFVVNYDQVEFRSEGTCSVAVSVGGQSVTRTFTVSKL